MEELLFLHDVVIVTNSRIAGVERKLAMLGDKYTSIPVVGNARKNALDLGWYGVDESIRPVGYERDVYLRRKLYWNTLTRLMRKKGLKPHNVLVIGDIYEMDLALPAQIGMRIMLAAKPSTPSFERNAVRTYQKADIVDHLPKALEHVRRYAA